MRLPGKYRIIAYIIYLTAVAGLFLFLLFPEDAVRDFIKRGVTRIDSNMRVDISGITPLFPPGVKFKGVSLLYKGKPVAKPDYIRISPRLLSLIGNSPRFFLKAGVFGGVIQGNGKLAETGKGEGDIRISGLELEKINELNGLSKHRITGRMDGNVKISTQGDDFNVHPDMTLSDLVVTLKEPVFGMQRFQFDTAKADLSITLRRMEIKAGTLEGEMFDGEFSGDILFKEPFKDSILNLKGSIRPQAAFIKQAGKTLPIDILMKKESGEKGLPVRLRGTIQDPQISLR